MSLEEIVKRLAQRADVLVKASQRGDADQTTQEKEISLQEVESPYTLFLIC